MAEKFQNEEFQELWSHLTSLSNHPSSENISMSLFSRLEQMLCPESRDYRSYVNFLKVNLQNHSNGEILIGTFTTICLLPRNLTARNSINYLLLAIKELNFGSSGESDFGSHDPLGEKANYLVSISTFPISSIPTLL
jgi:hypothetical protein